MFQRNPHLASIESKKHASIFESKQIREILNHCSFTTTVILDLDNTVMETSQELGSDQWFSALINHACKLDLNREESIPAVISIYNAVQHRAEMSVVEPNIVKIIAALQDIGVPIFALTSRGHQISVATIKQLEKMGIDFARHLGPDKFEIDIGSKFPLVIFHNGIIFCNGNEKGRCLKSFFERIDYFPKHVLMVDDKEKYLKCVEGVVKSYGGDFTGIRYSYLDDKVAAFDMKKAEEQLHEIADDFSGRIKDDLLKLKMICVTRFSFLSKEMREDKEPIGEKRKRL